MSRQSYTELLHDVALLKRILERGKIQKIRDPDPYTLGLKVRVIGQTYFLILSAHPLSARIGLSLTQPSTLPEPTGLGRWARAHLEGGRILDLTLLANDRIIALKTERGHLYLELIPRLENMYALNSQGEVHKWIGKHAHRNVNLGQQWTPPPRPTALTHSPEDLQFEWQTHPPALEKAIQSVLDREQQAAYQALHAESIQEKKQCASLLKDTYKRLTRLSEALWRDLDKGLKASEWKRQGELLKSHLHLIERGMTSVEVTDWYDPQMRSIEIPLDPILNGPENVDRLFHKQKKALKGAELAQNKLEEVESQLEEVNILRQQEHTSLSDLKQTLHTLGVYRKKQQQKQNKKAKVLRKPYRTFWSIQGEQIWLGRGGVDNHQMTFQYARGQDHWIHTRDVPGSHVIVPLKNRQHVPHHETLLDAAALSVHHSRLRGEENVAVYHTQRKHIRPIPKGPPGKVMVSDSRTLIAHDVEERIKRLYEEAKRRQALEDGAE